MDWKNPAILVAIKRFIIPVFIGAIVVWLIANGYSDWADALCSSSNAMGIDVKECMQ